jgi:hypothetical protein
MHIAVATYEITYVNQVTEPRDDVKEHRNANVIVTFYTSTMVAFLFCQLLPRGEADADSRQQHTYTSNGPHSRAGHAAP